MSSEQLDQLNEREFELINILGAELGSNQRDLSRMMDLSLGMVNMLLRRLVNKGYIRIHQLNKRKAEYLLTPKGFTEKMNKSVKYTLKTIHSLGVIRNRLKEVLSSIVQEGERCFLILGESDFATLVEMVLHELCKDGYQVKHIQEFPTQVFEGTLLICKENGEHTEYMNLGKNINLIEELARNYQIARLNEGVNQ